ncbi:hypothetical protein COE51_12400 [Bacillus pseudomycoides]|nr:hypothetical protein COE51_12400 [Bacillus pseudomycoides]
MEIRGVELLVRTRMVQLTIRRKKHFRMEVSLYLALTGSKILRKKEDSWKLAARKNSIGSTNHSEEKHFRMEVSLYPALTSSKRRWKFEE